MLSKTRAIVLHYIKYSETSVIVYCYTKKYGRISLIVQGVRKKNARIKLNLLQSLQVNEIDFYHKEKPGLMRLKEIKSCHKADGLLFDTRKSTVALFLAEILYKTLKEEVENPEQFLFIEEYIEKLDVLEKGYAEFYLNFLLEFSLYLGFYPNTDNVDNASFFDLKDGVFRMQKPNHSFFVKDTVLKSFKAILSQNNNMNSSDLIGKSKRNDLLNMMLDYYMLHMEGFSNIKSLQVLREVFE